MTLKVSVSHAYDGFSVQANFEAPDGVTVLFGRSGSGKTTVINAVAGLLRPDSGCIEIANRRVLDSKAGIFVPPHKRRIGYIFQEGRLFPHLTVKQNLQYGQRFVPSGVVCEDLDHVVDLLGLAHLLERQPVGLSGGEKQRVAIGRALLSGPELLLADEPLAALDETRKSEILPYFERLRSELSVPILYVSHSAAEVARLATTVVVLQDGRIARQGSAAEVLSDPTVMPTGVRAVGALLAATVKAHHADGLSELDVGGETLFLPKVSQSVGQSLRVRVPAQDVTLALTRPEGISALNIVPGVISQIRSGDGPGVMVSLETAAGMVLARVTRRSAGQLGLVEGMTCHAVIKTVAIAPEDVGGPAAGA